MKSGKIVLISFNRESEIYLEKKSVKFGDNLIKFLEAI